MVSTRTKTLILLPLLLGMATAHAAPGSQAKAPEGYVQLDDIAGAPPKVTGFQSLTADKTYHKTLERWAKAAGWKVSWELPDEYEFRYTAPFGTEFVKAVDGLCASLNSSGIRARSLAYPDNQVVRIVLEGAAQ